MMPASSSDLTKIDFGRNWRCLYQAPTDQPPISPTGSNQHWSSINLPHTVEHAVSNAGDGKWWYLKRFPWAITRHPAADQFFLQLSAQRQDESISDAHAVVWLNGKELWSGLLSSVNESIQVCTKLLRRECKRGNALVVCCMGGTLSLHAHLLVDARLICATGEVVADAKRKPPHVFDYTVTTDEADGRIGVVFNPQLKARPVPAALIHSEPASMSNDDEQTSTKAREKLLVPRLAVVMLVVGTEHDVRMFIALGQALHKIGHRIRLATHETFRSLIRESDLEFYPLPGDPVDLLTFLTRSTSIIPTIRHILEGNTQSGHQFLTELLASMWSACTAEDHGGTETPFTAEAIVANPSALGHIHCAEKLQIPLHIVGTMPSTPSAQFPHPMSNIDGSVGAKEKINWCSYDVIETLIWTGVRDVVNSFRRETLGLQELNALQMANVLYDERVPHTYCWSPALLAKPREWGAHIDVCDFLFSRSIVSRANAPDDLLKSLGIDIGRRASQDRQLIYVAFGSIPDDDSRRLMQVMLDAAEHTGYRIVISGSNDNVPSLPDRVLSIGMDRPDWLFHHVSAVCALGDTSAVIDGLRAGKPTIVVPFSGDQYFWSDVIERNGLGPPVLPRKSITAAQLADAFRFVHEPSIQTAAKRLCDAIAKEDGCTAAVYAFHANLSLARTHSDLEPTFAACYRVDKYHLQISRPVAHVLIAAGCLKETDLHRHSTREWHLTDDKYTSSSTHGIIEHLPKEVWHSLNEMPEEHSQSLNDSASRLGINHPTIDALPRASSSINTHRPDTSAPLKVAATWSSFPPRICQSILEQFEQIKRDYEQNRLTSIVPTQDSIRPTLTEF